MLGFTLVELIAVMMIVGVLAVVAVPRFFGSGGFDSRSFYDQTIATLRYAQKAAIAQHRFVCVAFTANSITLTQGTTNACGGTLASPAGTAAYVINAPNGVTLAGGANFNFNSVGQPSAGQSITVSGYAVPITVEAVTGYVH